MFSNAPAFHENRGRIFFRNVSKFIRLRVITAQRRVIIVITIKILHAQTDKLSVTTFQEKETNLFLSFFLRVFAVYFKSPLATGTMPLWR
jgi:isocitrate dehydrogenase kinase/phosphatase